MSEHIVKSYEDELNSLAAECARLGGLAEAQLADAIRAVTRREPDLAAEVIQHYGARPQANLRDLAAQCGMA
jgi:phosphate transport system protein